MALKEELDVVLSENKLMGEIVNGALEVKDGGLTFATLRKPTQQRQKEQWLAMKELEEACKIEYSAALSESEKLAKERGQENERLKGVIAARDDEVSSFDNYLDTSSLLTLIEKVPVTECFGGSRIFRIENPPITWLASFINPKF